MFVVEQAPAYIQPAPQVHHPLKHKQLPRHGTHKCVCIVAAPVVTAPAVVPPAPVVVVEPASPIKAPNFDWLPKVLGALLIGGALGIIIFSGRRLRAEWKKGTNVSVH
jgi:hypothetical protein